MFKYIHFDTTTGYLVIEAYGQQFNVEVPIEDGKYITGANLEAFIKARIPMQHIERQYALKDIPNAEDIVSLCSRVTQYREVSYSELREQSYPPYTDYLDAVVKGDAEQLQTYIDRCLEVKALYPKPEVQLVSDEVLKQRREGLS